MSAAKISNIPNGFEKLPKDLNAANLRIELKKLRATAKAGMGGDAGDDAAAPKKEEKKGAPAKPDPKAAPAKGGKGAPAKGAEPVKEEVFEEEEDDVIASEKELAIIQHIYVNMLL